MKRQALIAAFMLCISGVVSAQVEKTVTLDESTNLETALAALDVDINTITSLSIVNEEGATLSKTDFAILNDMKALEVLDLSEDKVTTTITSNAFLNNTTIKTISFPANLNNLEGGCFNNSALEGVLTFPSTLTSPPAIMNRFQNCQGITGFEFPGNGSLSSVDGVAYCDRGCTLLVYPCGKPDKEFSVPEGVTKIQDQSFFYNNILEVLNIPASVANGVDVSADKTFRYVTALKAINVDPENEYYASSYGLLVDKTSGTLVMCPPMIEQVVVDGSLVSTTPNYRFFGGAALVESMTFTEGVTSISDNGCRMTNSENLADGSGALKSIFLPSTLTAIGGNAFCRRGNVSMIVCRATTPPTVGGNAFFDCGKNDSDPLFVYVPAGSFSDYTNWGSLNVYGAQYKPFYAVDITKKDNATYDISEVVAKSVIGDGIAYEGAEVELTAPSTVGDFRFCKWESSSEDVTFENADSNTTTFIMPASDVNIYPTYTPPTGIEDVTVETMEENNAPAYDLTGRLVDDSYRGFVIQGGKKYFRK